MKLFKRLEYEVLGSTPIRNVLKDRPYQEWLSIAGYLRSVNVEGMRKTLCISCTFLSLYDKNNKQYKISRSHTLEQAKAIVEEIRKINQSE